MGDISLLETGSACVADLPADQDDLQGWDSVVIIMIGSYTVEYDYRDKSLTVTGGTITDVVCLDDDLKVAEYPECRTIVLRPPEER